MRLRRAALALAGLAVLVTSACSGSGGDKASAAPDRTPDSPQVSDGAVVEPVVAPLTGVVDPSGKVNKRPALSVKIDNAGKARPQVGLDEADLVFEEVVEGGVTRFIAVFHSTVPGEAGPVRSVRPMDPKIVSPLGGLVAYSGGIPEYVKMLRDAPVQDVNIDVATSAYRWAKDRPKPHNLMTNPGKLWALAEDDHSDPPPALFEYRAPGEAFGDADAASVSIRYSNFASAAYAWDAGSGTWKRSQDGVPHTVASKAQIATPNVIVQFVSSRKLDKVDASGHAVHESIVIGKGDAWVFSGGRVTKGRWSKADADSPTRYTDSAGNPVKLTPGRTWVHFATEGAGVSIG